MSQIVQRRWKKVGDDQILLKILYPTGDRKVGLETYEMSTSSDNLIHKLRLVAVKDFQQW